MRTKALWLAITGVASCGAPSGLDEGGVDEDVQGLGGPCLIDDRALIISDRGAMAAREVTLRRLLDAFAEETPDLYDTAISIFRTFPNYRNRNSPCVEPGLTIGDEADAEAELDRWFGVAFVNRFDLAEGRSCGEYRIVFGYTPHFMQRDHFTIIFEGVLPNPRPHRGLEGCRQVQRFWARVGAMPDAVDRVAELETFFFDGIRGYGRAASVDRYAGGDVGSGQVRGNFFFNADLGPWKLGEFALKRKGPRRQWTVGFVRTPVRGVLRDDIFQAGPPGTPEIAALREDLLAQIPSLTVADPNLIRFRVPPASSAECHGAAVNPIAEGYVSRFSLGGGDLSAFGVEMQQRMDAAGVQLIRPTHLVRRAFTQSCGGCHDDARADIGGGAVWPTNAPSEVFMIRETGALGVAMPTFLAHRRQNLATFLGCGYMP